MFPGLSPEQYLDLERNSASRNEYLNGEIFPVPVATANHARIVDNVIRHFASQFNNGAAVTGNVRLSIPQHRLFTYPDVVVASGPHWFSDDNRDTITDAAVIVEVLPHARINRLYYRSLRSLSDYVVIAQDRIRVVHFRREPDGAWLQRDLTAPEDFIEFPSAGTRVELKPVYETVEFASGAA